MRRCGRALAFSVLLVCAGLAGCRAADLADGGPMFDGPTDFATAPACQPTADPTVCAPVIECRACDAGLCGAIFDNAGCDFEDQVCSPTCGGPACTCLFGFWSCPPADGGTDGCVVDAPGAPAAPAGPVDAAPYVPSDALVARPADAAIEYPFSPP